MNEIDFGGKTVLVIGGSSGIGNGIARQFLNHGAEVYVCGTRATAEDYTKDEGTDLTDLHYFQLDVSKDENIENLTPPFDNNGFFPNCGYHCQWIQRFHFNDSSTGLICLNGMRYQ